MSGAEDILKAGWLDKEYTSRSWFKYRPRYVVLTTLNLKYYYQQNEAYDSNVDGAKQDIPLLTVNDAAVLDHGAREPEIVHIETTGRTWRFKAPNAAEADQWRQAIFAARNRLGVSRVHFGALPGKVGTRPLSAVREEEEGEEEGRDAVQPNPLDDLWASYQANEELINALENVTCSSMDKAKYTANLFFESVGQMPSKERAMRAKEMARSLIAWVGDGSERVGSGYDSCLKSDVFAMWVRIALSREFVASCKFDESNASNMDEDASSESSCMTHSTIKSRMKNIRIGTIIMPFRADTAECLFVSSAIHAASLKYNFIKLLLHGPLRNIALNPDLHVYPRNLPLEVQHTANGPPVAGHGHGSTQVHLSSAFSHAHKEKDSSGSGSNLRESLSRQSSRFMGIFRNVFARPSGGRPSSMSLEDRPMSVDAARPSSAMLSSYLFLINSKTQNQEAAAAALNELALLTPLDLKRLEVRKRLQDCAALIVQRFEEVRGQFPTAIATILSTIRDLIIVTSARSAGSSGKGKDLTKEGLNDADEHESELYRNRRRYEYGTFFTSCSALLFLRLICRAIISPDDYGVTKHVASQSSSTRQSRRVSKSYADAVTGSPGSSDVSTRADVTTHQFPKAVAPMVLLAHAVAYDPNDDSSHKKAPRRELLDSRYAAEILSLSKNLSQQMPSDTAVKCTDAMQNAYLTPETKPATEAAIRAEAEEHYLFDFSKPVTRWALAEVAKTVQHIANISCLPKEEMQAFAKDSLIRQNIGAGKQDKDSYDTYVLTGYEQETISVQVELAAQMKRVYEFVGELGPSNW